MKLSQKWKDRLGFVATLIGIGVFLDAIKLIVFIFIDVCTGISHGGKFAWTLTWSFLTAWSRIF